jgi:hypothetical protein
MNLAHKAVLRRDLTAEDADHAGSDDEGRVDLFKESASKYKYYASGRRFVDGMLVTLDLRARQDLLMGYVVNALMPQDDILDLEV